MDRLSFGRICWLASFFPAALFAQSTVRSVTPNNTPAYSPATVITISGGNFAAQSSVVFTPPYGGATTITPSDIQPAQIVATIPANLLSVAGAAQVAVQNTSGALSNPIPFAIASPVMTSVIPNGAVAHSKPVTVTIAGSNIVSTAVVSFTSPGGVTLAIAPIQVKGGQIVATIPAAVLSSTGAAQIAIQNGPGAVSNQLPFTIGASISVKPAPLKDATAGAEYFDTLTASGGTAPYIWSLFSGALPAGLALSSDGTIFGNPTTAGPSGFSLQVTDASGAIATTAGSITVKGAGVAVTTLAFPQGIQNFEYPRQVLTASGAGPWTFAITSGSLPAGLTLADGVISGLPIASGTSSFTITVADSSGATGSARASIVIRGPDTDLLLLAGAASFSLKTGASGVPEAQSVGVQSPDVLQTLQYSTDVSAAPWLSVTSDGVTPGSITLSLTQAALSLSDGTSLATVTVTCTSNICAGKSQTIVVSLAVSSPPEQLNVSISPLTFHAPAIGGTPQSQNLIIQNSGSGSLDLISITCGAPWCSVGTFPESVSAGPGTQVAITVDPAKLPAGSDYRLKPGYLTAVQIASSAGSASVSVSLFVSAKPYLSLSQSGDQFSMQPGSPGTGNPPGSFLVTATGGAANWTATVQPGADWLTVSTPSGISSDAQPGGVVYSINSSAANLAAGTYFGNIVVDATDASSGVLNFVVVLNVTPVTQPPTLALSPGALVFVTTPGASPSAQNIGIYTNSTAPQAWQGAPVANNAGWLSILDKGSTSSVRPGQSIVTVDAANLKQGVYSGHISYALGAIGIRRVEIKLVVLPAVATLPGERPAGDAPALTPKADCAPSSLVLTPAGLSGNFDAPASWPTPISMTLINDCGKPVANGQVVVTFSNGDPPMALSLASGASGLYAATWTPHNPAAQLTINARGTAPGFDPVTTPVTGSVVPNVAPVLTPNGTVHPYNTVLGGALAPGTIVAIYGSNMATVTAIPSTTPLPTKVNGTTVLMGGIPAPLFYVSATQINAQIPFELDLSKQYQIILNANGALSTPLPLQLSAATPGLDAFLDGTIIALHVATGALVSASDPARPGEFIVMFLLGMGATDNSIVTGDAAPASPFNRPLSTPTLTLAGKPVPVGFAGLTPGFVGLYQINLQIPDVELDGNLVLTVSQNGDTSNSTILPVLR